MGRSKFGIVVFLFVVQQFFASVASLKAAEINIIPDSGDGVSIVSVEGEILKGDEERFENAALSINRAIVLFNSPGGSTIAGIGIGKTIRLRGFSTGVMDDHICASACGLAWLGGTKRMMFPKSKVGFHASYIEYGDIKLESGVGNALVGAYLNQVGLTSSAIFELTIEGPNSMKWITPEVATRYGIDTVFIPESSNDENKRIASTPSTQPDTSNISPRFLREPNRDIYGYDLFDQPMSVSSIDICEFQCMENTSCQAYSFVESKSQCYLKSGGTTVLGNPTTTTGYRASLQSKLRMSSITIYPSHDIEGKEYQFFLNSRTENCVEICEKDSNCAGFKFSRKEQGRCSLRQSPIRKIPAKGSVVGIKK
jgi:hypothetical protein